METRDLICIGCPLGCPLIVEITDGVVTKVEGNTCPKGKSYAEKEVTAPTRTVTSTVRVAGSKVVTVSVKTAQEVPKGKIVDVMLALKPVTMTAPVAIGDVIVADVAGTGVDIVATSQAS